MNTLNVRMIEETYSQLRAEAERRGISVSLLVHEAIALYAAEMAGTDLDMDSELESAGIEHLLSTPPRKQHRVELPLIRSKNPGSLRSMTNAGVDDLND